MPYGTHADVATLDAIANCLRKAGDGLDAAGRSATTAPDAGAVAPDMIAVLAHLTESAGNLVIGLCEASARVFLAREAYVAQDAAASQSLRDMF